MNLQDYISRLSPRFGIPSQLVFALIRVESNMSMTAIRHEPHYRWLWNNQTQRPFRRLEAAEVGRASAPDDFRAGSSFYSSHDTEWMGQRTSWGPFQMMGAVLRERGYKGPFPAICSDPELATRFALLHLEHLKLRYVDKHGWAGVMAAYNAGRPRLNPDGTYVNREYLVRLNRLGGKGWLSFV